jgi:hypothetical protein
MKDCGCGNGKNCISKKAAKELIVPFVNNNPAYNRKSRRTLVTFINKELKKLDCGCGCRGMKGFKKKYLTGSGVLSDCPAGWRNDGLTCVEPCPEGMRDDGLTCRERCGPDEIDDGLTCRKKIESSMNSCPEGSKDVAGTCWGVVRKDCIDDCFKHPAPGCRTYECGRLRGLVGDDWGPKLCTDCNLRCGQTCWDVQGITKQLHERGLKVWGGEVRGQRIIGKRITGRINWDVLMKDLVQGLIDFTTGKLDYAALFDPEKNGVGAAFRKFGEDTKAAFEEVGKRFEKAFDPNQNGVRAAMENFAKVAEANLKQFGQDFVDKCKDPDMWVQVITICAQVAGAVLAAAIAVGTLGAGTGLAIGLGMALNAVGPAVKMIADGARGKPIDGLDIAMLALALVPPVPGAGTVMGEGMKKAIQYGNYAVTAGTIIVAGVRVAQVVGVVPSTCIANCPPPTNIPDPEPEPIPDPGDDAIIALRPEENSYKWLYDADGKRTKNPNFISDDDWLKKYREENPSARSTNETKVEAGDEEPEPDFDWGATGEDGEDGEPDFDWGATEGADGEDGEVDFDWGAVEGADGEDTNFDLVDEEGAEGAEGEEGEPDFDWEATEGDEEGAEGAEGEEEEPDFDEPVGDEEDKVDEEGEPDFDWEATGEDKVEDTNFEKVEDEEIGFEAEEEPLISKQKPMTAEEFLGNKPLPKSEVNNIKASQYYASAEETPEQIPIVNIPTYTPPTNLANNAMTAKQFLNSALQSANVNVKKLESKLAGKTTKNTKLKKYYTPADFGFYKLRRGGAEGDEAQTVQPTNDPRVFINPYTGETSKIENTGIPANPDGTEFKAECYAKNYPEMATELKYDMEQITNWWVSKGHEAGDDPTCGTFISNPEERTAYLNTLKARETTCKAAGLFWDSKSLTCDETKLADGSRNLNRDKCLRRNGYYSNGKCSLNRNQKGEFDGEMGFPKTKLCSARGDFTDENEANARCDASRNVDGKNKTKSDACTTSNNYWDEVSKSCDYNRDAYGDSKGDKEVCEFGDNYWDGSNCDENKDVFGEMKNEIYKCLINKRGVYSDGKCIRQSREYPTKLSGMDSYVNDTFSIIAKSNQIAEALRLEEEVYQNRERDKHFTLDKNYYNAINYYEDIRKTLTRRKSNLMLTKAYVFNKISRNYPPSYSCFRDGDVKTAIQKAIDEAERYYTSTVLPFIKELDPEFLAGFKLPPEELDAYVLPYSKWQELTKLNFDFMVDPKKGESVVTFTGLGNIGNNYFNVPSNNNYKEFNEQVIAYPIKFNNQDSEAYKGKSNRKQSLRMLLGPKQKLTLDDFKEAISAAIPCE